MEQPGGPQAPEDGGGSSGAAKGENKGEKGPRRSTRIAGAGGTQGALADQSSDENKLSESSDSLCSDSLASARYDKARICV